MANKDIVVIGASTGGIEALRNLVSTFPPDLKASIFVVVHTSASSPSVLGHILDKAGPLSATNATDWEEIVPGHIYVAPPDHHLLVDRLGYTRLTRGPKENGFRPAVDPLFRSAAEAFGPRVVGVILSGHLDDGTSGLWAVKQCGGTAIVQNPEEAVASSMPMNALKRVEVDHCVPLVKIGSLLVQLASTPTATPVPVQFPRELELEVKIAKENNALNKGIMKWGEPSVFACPECHGVLLQLKEGSNLRFRCHTGHAYAIETLLSHFHEKTEETLWNTLRALDETILLLDTMADLLAQHEHHEDAEKLREKGRQSKTRSNLVREAIFHPADLTVKNGK